MCLQSATLSYRVLINISSYSFRYVVCSYTVKLTTVGFQAEPSSTSKSPYSPWRLEPEEASLKSWLFSRMDARKMMSTKSPRRCRWMVVYFWAKLLISHTKKKINSYHKLPLNRLWLKQCKYCLTFTSCQHWFDRLPLIFSEYFLKFFFQFHFQATSYLPSALRMPTMESL